MNRGRIDPKRGEAIARLSTLARATDDGTQDYPQAVTNKGREMIMDLKGFEEAYKQHGGKLPYYDDYEENVQAAVATIS